MKNIFKNISYRSLVAVVALSVMATSCEDFFETPIAEGITNETIYSSMYNAERALNAAYYAVPYEFSYNGTNFDTDYRTSCSIRLDIVPSISDEAVSVCTWSGAPKGYYGDGTMNALTAGIYAEDTTKPMDFEYNFEEFYYYIRYAYLFLESVNSVPDATPQWIAEKTAEAKILIAISWYELIKRYGSVPYVTKALSANDDFGTALDRPDLLWLIEDVDRIIAEAIDDAPDKIAEESEDYGRVTKATAYFLRSNLWLLAASPIFNTDTPYSTTGLVDKNEICLGYAKGSAEWTAVWQKAADYALAAINHCEGAGYYMSEVADKTDKAAVVEAYREVFRGVINNPEVIQFSRRKATFTGVAKTADWIGRNLPPTMQSGYTWANTAFCSPQQGFISEMVRNLDGSKLVFGQEGGAEPWANADYRFEANVVYDGCDWGYGTTMSSDHPYASITGTGYFLRKYMHDEWQTGSYSIDVPYYYMRLPELYINYAEALCELSYSSNMSTIQAQLNKVAARVGAYQVQMDSSWTYEEVRDEIRREKAMEFMFETHRYFDVKRWLIADQTIGKDKYALVREGESCTDPNRYYVETWDLADMTSRQTNWNDKLYLMPFPQYEILKDMGLNQNPGY